MYSVNQYIPNMRSIISVENMFSLLIDFLTIWKFWFLIRMIGNLMDYREFGVWEFYKFGDESNW